MPRTASQDHLGSSVWILARPCARQSRRVTGTDVLESELSLNGVVSVPCGCCGGWRSKNRLLHGIAGLVLAAAAAAFKWESVGITAGVSAVAKQGGLAGNTPQHVPAADTGQVMGV